MIDEAIFIDRRMGLDARVERAEIGADLADLECVRRKLGGWWSCLYTDVTEGVAGNGERLAFLFDSRTVRMSGLAGEIVLPGKKKQPVLQFARTPFTCGFEAGDKQLELCTVHVYWGKSVAVTPERVAEIENVARALAKRAKKRHAPSAPHMLLMGDFNIFNRDDATFAALTKAGFTICRRASWRPRRSAAGRRLLGSRAALASLGVDVRSFAYPDGRWSPGLLPQVRSAGYVLGLTLDPGPARVGGEPLALPRGLECVP